MDPYYQALGGNNALDRQLAMSILMNGGASASEAVQLARLQQDTRQLGLQEAAQAQTRLHPSLGAAVGYSTDADLLRRQRDLLNQEIAARAAAFPSFGFGGADSLPFLGLSGLNPAQHPPLSSLLAQQVTSHPSALSLPPAPMAAAAAAIRRNSPPLSPLKSDSDVTNANAGTLQSLKRAAVHHRDSLGGCSQSSDTSNKRARLATYPPSPSSLRVQLMAPGRGSKAKLRDDFWGKVGKNNSHIHLVNIVLGRLLYDQVRQSKGGNKVLSNDLIQQILEHKLYGKYAVKDFFASTNKASETIRNTWTRLNFAQDNIRKGLSRYKEQTWQAIERCGFEDPAEEDIKEMDQALKIFVTQGRFVAALDVALKGIITEPFMGVLMQLRLEWNGLCLNCRPEEHDTVVAGFLRKYGMNGK